VTFVLSYSIRPDREEAKVFEGAVSVSTAAAIAELVLAGLSFASWGGVLRSLLVPLGVGLLAVVIGFLGFATNPLTHRTKLWMLFPIMASVVAIAIGTVG
jgi:hypothetical protein